MPSTVWVNDYLPYPVQTVTRLTLADGRGQIAVTDLTYSGALFDHSANKFLGFRKVIESRPLANGETARPTVETTYRQRNDIHRECYRDRILQSFQDRHDGFG
jgi:hypothetical protein